MGSERRTAIIGGTGLDDLPGLSIKRELSVETPYGEPSGPIVCGELEGTPLWFLPRHGSGHSIPPHRINYRANIYALKQAGITDIIGVNAVGGIAANMAPRAIAVPDQLVDYSYGREHTFFDGSGGDVQHIDFTHPFTPELRERLLRAAEMADVEVVDGSVYGCTQGPRLESAAEINRLDQDGCTVVGMTGMPEAALAQELGMNYAMLALVVNWAAGRDECVTMALIEEHLVFGMVQVRRLLGAVSKPNLQGE